MNSSLDRMFPMGGSIDRLALPAPRPFASPPVAPGFPMSNRAFMRTWAARRARIAVGAPAGVVPPAPSVGKS